MQQFGIYIIGDEILSGKKQDAHLSFVIQALKSRGLQLAWAHYLSDIPEQITPLLKDSMLRGDIVFSFGGIGATPDDFTRQCAADAAGLPIVRHAGALAEIEAQYGKNTHPRSALMADLPLGVELIPNPVNRVAGFSINRHHFVPGFPQMAHPMVEWVLDTHYQHLFHTMDYTETSIMVMDAGESQLIDLMNQIVAKYPKLKLFSLPKLDNRRTIELGVKGAADLTKAAMDEIKQAVTALGFPWEEL